MNVTLIILTSSASSLLFFFSSRRRHTRLTCDWSSDVCSSDLLAASFSPELVDAAIYVIDVAGGDKIPRKGGPGITRSDLLVINKIDLAPHVGADLAVMDRDAKLMRGSKAFFFTNMKTGEGVQSVVDWIRDQVLFESS